MSHLTELFALVAGICLTPAVLALISFLSCRPRVASMCIALENRLDFALVRFERFLDRLDR